MLVSSKTMKRRQKTSIIYILFFVAISFFSNGQETSFPKGAYKTLDELRNRTPSIPYSFIISRRTDFDIKMVGGNDYFVKSTNPQITKNQIKKEFFAISNGDTLFLNCFNLKLQNWYTIAKHKDSVLIFKAGIPQIQNKELYKQANTDAHMAAMAFGPVSGGIAGAKAAMIRYLYVMNLKTEKIELLSENYLKRILAPKPGILKMYEAEKIKNSEDILLKYYSLSRL